MSMPDTWEYPWFAAWDLAFHCVTLAHVDPAFAKYQLLAALPRVVPAPERRAARLRVVVRRRQPAGAGAGPRSRCSRSTAAATSSSSSRIFDKLLVNFTWWVNREDADGTNLFEGGFLGLDNIGPIDRSHLPAGHTLEQSDATGWMAFYALSDGGDRLDPRRHGRPGDRPRAQVPRALRADLRRDPDAGPVGRGGRLLLRPLRLPDGTVVPIKVRSMVGVLPLPAFAVIDEPRARARPDARQAVRALLGRAPARPRPARRRGRTSSASRASAGSCSASSPSSTCCASSRGSSTRRRSSRRTGCGRSRAGTASTRTSSSVDGVTATIDYEPAESTTGDVRRQLELARPGLVPASTTSSSTRSSATHASSATTSRSSTRPGPGSERTLGGGRRGPPPPADLDLPRRSRRPAARASAGSRSSRPTRPGATTSLFNEYFHGDNGAGLGASHQTGWTGLVADLIRRSGGSDVPTLGDLMEPSGRRPGE